MAFHWTEDLATGNAIIDREHKQLIDMIGQLMDACSKGKGRDEVVKTLDFLNQYTIQHFSHEEALQKQYQYPDLQNHLRYHQEFRQTVQRLTEQARREGAAVALLAEINRGIALWFTSHIRQQDKRVAAHIKAMTQKK